MTEDPRIVSGLALLLRAWLEEASLRDEAAARQRQAGDLRAHMAPDLRDVARDALRDLNTMGLWVVHVANDQPGRCPGGAA